LKNFFLNDKKGDLFLEMPKLTAEHAGGNARPGLSLRFENEL
jgi:hypothetical protein